MIITHRKGRHRSKPFLFDRLSEGCWVVKFNDSCKYVHPDNDQWDFNKLVGIKKNFFRPRKNSIMVGWRYNDVADKIELVPYVHEDGHTFFEYVPVHIDIDENATILIQDDIVTIKERNFKVARDWDRGYLINSWFGGQKRAPHKITFELERIW